MTTTKQYDLLNRLTQISSAPSGTGVPPVVFNYTYNAANQRTKNALADGSYWIYQYDLLGQVTGGVKYFYDGTVVPGQTFGYQFDDIGNRKQTTAGGDQNGQNLRLASYLVNNLNQITNRIYPGTNDVIGVALATNSVMVNGQTAFHKGEYFWGTAKTNNANGAQWLGVNVSSGGVTNMGSLYVPKTPEQFGYDPDGNLTNDGRWAYTWDAENRLIQMTVNTNVGPQYQLTFGYDAKSRRIQKLMALNGTTVSTNKFLYDGWNLVAELKPDNTRLRTYVWGSDLSGSLQGAGGVGGLLEVSYYGTSTTNCFPAFDGNGNLAALVNAADGTSVANYEYGPFGETVRMTGTLARNNPFRFSTKYQDDESDLLYYGYRSYKPSTGTWVNRDPLIDEYQILNQNINIVSMSPRPDFASMLYSLNNPISCYDSFGLWTTSSSFFLVVPDGLPLTHQNSIRRSISGLTEHDYDILDAATLEVDARQETTYSYRHAMRAPGQTIDEAKYRSNDYVRGNLFVAQTYLCCPIDRDKALHYFGLALHTIQDATSPVHTGFLEWKGIWGVQEIFEAGFHIAGENFDPGLGSRLDKATALLWTTYFKCYKDAGAGHFPNNFFDGLGFDRKPN